MKFPSYFLMYGSRTIEGYRRKTADELLEAVLSSRKGSTIIVEEYGGPGGYDIVVTIKITKKTVYDSYE